MTDINNALRHDAALREQADLALRHALDFDFQGAQWAVPGNSTPAQLKEALERIEAELHADGDFRDMLLCFRDCSIEHILTELLDDYFRQQPMTDWYCRDKPKLLDLHHCYILLNYFDDPKNYCQEIITEAAMRHSLCPMHLIDWAICFDDADDECSAIRAIYPHSHDT